jgi:hypothetical protein
MISAKSTTSPKRQRRPGRCADLPLTVWPCAQRSSQSQRRGRFVTDSYRHPGKMLPEIARRAIHAYSRPGDLILDPMCGIATTLVEAIHLDRQAVGIELEARWKAVAAKNIANARRQGAQGQAHVLRGDARRLGHGVLDDLTGRVPLILTSPPYANAQIESSRRMNARIRACTGQPVSGADRALALQPKCTSRYGDSRGSVARLRYGTTTNALPPPEAGGKLSVGYGLDLYRLRPDAHPWWIPRARHQEHAC